MLAPDAAAAPPPTPDSDWRKHLVTAEQKSQEDLDKALLSLSGGALGVSFVFLKDIVGLGPLVSTWSLLLAWGSWTASTMTVLLSYYGSVFTIQRAITRLDAKQPNDRAFALLGAITRILNAAGGLLFAVGVASMLYFVVMNFHEKGTANGVSNTSSGSTGSASKAATNPSPDQGPSTASSGIRPAQSSPTASQPRLTAK